MDGTISPSAFSSCYTTKQWIQVENIDNMKTDESCQPVIQYECFGIRAVVNGSIIVLEDLNFENMRNSREVISWEG